MPIFRYRARSRSGEPIEGTVEAETEKEALEDLSSRGIFPMSMREAAGVPDARPPASLPEPHNPVAGRIGAYYKIRGETRFRSTEQFLAAATEEDSRQRAVVDRMSADGVVLSAWESIRKGSVLEVEIDMPDGGVSIKGVARVTDSRNVEGGGAHNITVSFLNLSRDERGRIENCLQDGF